MIFESVSVLPATNPDQAVTLPSERFKLVSIYTGEVTTSGCQVMTFKRENNAHLQVYCQLKAASNDNGFIKYWRSLVLIV